MNVALDAPKRPALRYFGGKWDLAPWIISFFPTHESYVETCCGACSVLLRKPRSKLETINDLDGSVTSFFEVLRDRRDELIRKIRLTPWARAEFLSSFEPCADELERARRFFVRLWMSMDGSGKSKSWGIHKNPARLPWTPRFAQFENTKDGLREISNRLLRVQIENRDARDVIVRYNYPETLFYHDPPYLKQTRRSRDVYRLEVNRDFHIETAGLLRQCQGYVVVSGYTSDLYTELYEAHGWQRFDREAQSNSGGRRIESAWLSPRTVEALGRPMQAKLI